MSVDLTELLESWQVHLRAERKSTETVKSYATGVRQFLDYCTEHDLPAVLDKATVRGYVAHCLEAGAEPATARARQLSLKRFSAWLAEEGEITHDELAGLKPPKLDEKVVEPLTTEQCQALLKACAGKRMFDRRDEAIVRIALETGARASELVSMTVSGINVRDGAALITRGKGGKGRVVPFSPHAGKALDRYLRVRKTHRLAGQDALWLGDRGKELGYYGLHSALKARAEAAGIVGFYPHRLRNTFASRWLAAGGSEGGLMAVAGWSRRDMVDRYVKATAADRAAEEARGLGLGDL